LRNPRKQEFRNIMRSFAATTAGKANLSLIFPLMFLGLNNEMAA
jgi:hypothetical protein